MGNRVKRKLLVDEWEGGVHVDSPSHARTCGHTLSCVRASLAEAPTANHPLDGGMANRLTPSLSLRNGWSSDVEDTQ